MACFLVPLALAICITCLKNIFPSTIRIGWLNSMLWGGVLVLIAEHAIHGEITLYPPFFTAGISQIFSELFTVGVPMTLTVTGIWTAMVTIDLKMLQKQVKPPIGP